MTSFHQSIGSVDIVPLGRGPWACFSALGLAAMLGMASMAQAQTRGMLKYPDGTVLPGLLLDSPDEGGLFRSDRFGEVRFAKGEASFEPAPAPTPVKQKATWQPDSSSIGVSGYWQTSNGSQESDAALDLAATWLNERDELGVNFSADYKVAADSVDNNEQKAQLRWLHSLASPWVSVVGARAHRFTYTYEPLPTLDYLLFQGTLGIGLRKSWAEGRKSLVALSHERVALEVLDFKKRIFTSATSLLLENNVHLTAKISFDQTLYLYLWRDGDTGIDSRAEISYAVTEQLSVGLRHEYRRNAVDLDIGGFSKLSLTTRLDF